MGVMDEDNIELCRSIIANEVEMVSLSMDASKAPGPNSFCSYSYKHYWEIIKGDFWLQSNISSMGTFPNCGKLLL